MKNKFLKTIHRSKFLPSRFFKSTKSIDEIPGPKPLPFIGNMMDMKTYGGEYDYLSFRDFQVQLHSKYGDIVKWGFRKPNIYLSNCDYIKEAFKNEGPNPYRSVIHPFVIVNKKFGSTKSLFNNNDEEWRKLRTIANPIVGRPHTVHSYLSNHNQVANEFVELIRREFKIKNQEKCLTFDNFEQNLYLLSLEYITNVMLNCRLKCMDVRSREPRVFEFINAVNKFFNCTGKLLFSKSFWRYWSTQTWKEFEESALFLFNEIYSYIKKAHDELQINRMCGKPDELTMLNQFLINKDEHQHDLKDIVAIMTDMMIAAVDSTATTLYYVLYELGLNQDKQEILFKEINTVLEGRHSEDVTVRDLEDMKYLKMVLKETLRLHTIVTSQTRVINSDMEVGGYFIPKGTKIVMSNACTSKSEKYFGKNVLDFDPYRWSKAKQKTCPIHPFSTLSFGFGTRNCIGKRLAEQEIYLTIIKVIQNFKVVYKGPIPSVKLSLIATPDIPLRLTLIKRHI